MAEQYFNASQLRSRAPNLDSIEFKLVSTDSYSDEEVWNNIIASGSPQILAVCALQTAIIGLGNKTYGQFEYQGSTQYVLDVYNAKGVKLNSTLGSKLSPGDLTPRRLNRAFRLLVHDYLIKNPLISSYLWRKYTPKNSKYRISCFPGAEHLVETNEEAAYLYNAYKELDARMSTNIANRIARVLSARGLVTQSTIA